MALINFPSAPAIGQVYKFGDYTYTYDGVKWTSVTTYSGSSTKVISDVPPPYKEEGMQWFDTKCGRSYVWEGGAWVEDSPQALTSADGAVKGSGSGIPEFLSISNDQHLSTGSGYALDVSKKSLTAYLPPMPTDGDMVYLKDSSGTCCVDHTITIRPTGGSKIYGDTFLVLDTPNICIGLMFVGVDNAWEIVTCVGAQAGAGIEASVKVYTDKLDSVIHALIGTEVDLPPSFVNRDKFLVEKNGQLLTRFEYPFLWSWISAHPEVLITEGEYSKVVSASYTSSCSKYSSGNGLTTFRVPTVGTGGFSHHIHGITDDINGGFRDEIQNITGSMGVDDTVSSSTSGALYDTGNVFKYDAVSVTNKNSSHYIGLDASRQVRTGTENTPKGHYVRTFIYTGNQAIKRLEMIEMDKATDVDALKEDFANVRSELTFSESKVAELTKELAKTKEQLVEFSKLPRQHFKMVSIPDGDKITPFHRYEFNVSKLLGTEWIGDDLVVQVEILVNGEWFDPGMVCIHKSGGWGTEASVIHDGTTIVIQTGTAALTNRSDYNGIGITAEDNVTVTSASGTRIKCWKII